MISSQVPLTTLPASLHKTLLSYIGVFGIEIKTVQRWHYIQQPAININTAYVRARPRPRDRVYAVSALRNHTFQLHNSRIGQAFSPCVKAWLREARSRVCRSDVGAMSLPCRSDVGSTSQMIMRHSELPLSATVDNCHSVCDSCPCGGVKCHSVCDSRPL